MEHKYPYEWTLKDAVFTKDKGTVFSCFACGGGSTMGYKLAGFDVVGCNEIDPKMMECYKINHNPKYSYLEPIQTFKNRDDLPEALYNLDILDGSPPCSSFSTAGNREKDWGKEKKFSEGQSKQVLDTLFFDFIDLAKKLQPKIIIAENVKGLLMGEAKQYIKLIIKAFDNAGYRVDYKLLDASKMGVPQRRERVFFYAVRNDIQCETIDLFKQQPFVELLFDEKKIPFVQIEEKNASREKLRELDKKRWESINENENYSISSKGNTFGFLYKALPNKVFATVLATPGHRFCHYDNPEKITKKEFIKIGTFPIDYNFLENKAQYLIGMSVPPVMMAQIATRIYNQWLKTS